MERLKNKKILIFCNFIFVIYGLHWFMPIKPFFLYFLIGLITFIIPGLAWMTVINNDLEDIATAIFKTIFLSTLIMIASLGLYSLFKIKIEAISHALILLVITNTAFLIKGRFQQQYQAKIYTKKISFVLIAVIFVFLYSMLYLFTLKVVPPLEDDDLELQGTSYGLAREFKPFLLTDRKTYFYFAHPLLSHLYTANFFILSGQLDNAKFYYDIAKEAQRLENETLQTGQTIMLYSRDIGDIKYRVDASNDKEVILNRPIQKGVEFDYGRDLPEGERKISTSLLKKGQIWRLIKDEYLQFSQNPNILLTRSANVFLSALTGILLFYIICQLCNSLSWGLISVILYFSFPSILVLTTSEIYTSISNFALLAMFWACIRKDRKNCRGYRILPGIFAGLANHKLFIFPLAVVIMSLLQRYHKRFNCKMFSSILRNRIVIGFILGTVIFWAYGLLINAKIFLLDHIQYHIVNRILHKNVLGYSGYPAVGELWNNFLSKPFLVVCIPLVLIFMIRGNSRDSSEKLLPIWFLAGALIFSIVDWREITHLALIILPLVISTIIFMSRQKRLMRFLLIAALVFVGTSNALFLWKGLQDFSLIASKLGWS